MCFGPQRCALFRHLNFQKWSETVSFLHSWLENVLRATAACTFSTSQLPNVVWDRQFFTLLTWKCASRHIGVHFFDISAKLPKVVRICNALCILTWKCASHHNGVHFFDISTSKSGLRPSVFYTLDFKTRFAPQRRALFRHLNFQTWSETVSFFTLLTWKCASRHNGVHLFDISTSRTCGVLYILTSKCASRRHNGAQLFYLWSGQLAPHPALASLLFDLPEPQSIGKTQWLATFIPFRAPASSFFSDLLTSFLLLSDSSHLCFSNCPYCQKFHL